MTASSDLTHRLQNLTEMLAVLVDEITIQRSQAEGNPIENHSPIFFQNLHNKVEKQSVRGSRPPLPDPRLVRRIIRQRQLRSRYFPRELFGDPAWDMLLDLTAARAEHVRVSVTSLCIASGVPATTALRWISQLMQAGLLLRLDDETDRRRAFLTLSDHGVEAVARYFSDVGPAAPSLI
jgi:hypothetical protein